MVSLDLRLRLGNSVRNTHCRANLITHLVSSLCSRLQFPVMRGRETSIDFKLSILEISLSLQQNWKLDIRTSASSQTLCPLRLYEYSSPSSSFMSQTHTAFIRTLLNILQVWTIPPHPKVISYLIFLFILWGSWKWIKAKPPCDVNNYLCF